MTRGRQIGEPAYLYIDAAQEMEEGDVVRTPSGKSYRVVSTRIQQKGKHIGRQHLQTIVIDPKEVSSTDTVLEIHWYPRGR